MNFGWYLTFEIIFKNYFNRKMNKKIWVGGFFLPAINATVYNNVQLWPLIKHRYLFVSNLITKYQKNQQKLDTFWKINTDFKNQTMSLSKFFSFYTFRRKHWVTWNSNFELTRANSGRTVWEKKNRQMKGVSSYNLSGKTKTIRAQKMGL